jgi:hypothetical protein
LNVEVVGINRSDQSGNNHLVTGSRSLPWVQDTIDADLWNSWNVAWRDVRIVSSQQKLAGVYNLSSNNLGLPINRTSLKNMLLKEAIVQDLDEDGLRDDWEALHLQELASTSGANDDPDGDGYSNFAEYAFGSNPLLATSVPETFAWSRRDNNGDTLRGLVMRRRAGTTVDYGCQSSQDLATWMPADSRVQWVGLDRIFDGTGTFLAYAASVVEPDDDTPGFLRVEAKQK